MEIIGASDHQLLGYALAVQQQGYRLTVDEFGAYAASPSRQPAQTELRAGAFANLLPAFGYLASQLIVTSPGEKPLDHFCRVKWISVDDGRVTVTQLGRAVVMAADAESPADEVVQAALDPNDPLAYARLVARLTQLEDVMVVDPYFRATQLLQLYELPTLTRVLTSEKIGKKDLVAIRSTAGVITWDRTFEIRAAPPETGVHDRYLIPRVGAIFQVGTSLKGVGHSFTVMSEMQDVSELVRERFEAIWKDSGVIFPANDDSSEQAAAPAD